MGLVLYLIFDSIIPGLKQIPPPSPTSSASIERQSNEELGLRFDRTQFSGNYLLIELYSEHPNAGIKSYTKRETRNVGVHNLTNGKTNWLFPNNAQHIDKNIKITKTVSNEAGKTESVIVGHFLVTSMSDPEGNVIKDIWAASLDGSNVQKLLCNIKEKPSFKTFGNNEARILLEDDDVLQIIKFDIDKRTIYEAKKIYLPK